MRSNSLSGNAHQLVALTSYFSRMTYALPEWSVNGFAQGNLIAALCDAANPAEEKPGQIRPGQTRLVRSRRRFLGKNQDQDNDRGEENDGRGIAAEGESAARDWFVEEIAQGCSERPGQNKSNPKQERV